MTARPLAALLALALAVVTGCANDDNRAELERLTAQVAALEAAQTSTTTTLPVTTSTSTTAQPTTATLMPVTTTEAVTRSSTRLYIAGRAEAALAAARVAIADGDLQLAAEHMRHAAHYRSADAALHDRTCPAAAAISDDLAEQLQIAAMVAAIGGSGDMMTRALNADDAQHSNGSDLHLAHRACYERDRARQ